MTESFYKETAQRFCRLINCFVSWKIFCSEACERFSIKLHHRNFKKIYLTEFNH